jgi:nucleoside-diphosphate-sugar epimerase
VVAKERKLLMKIKGKKVLITGATGFIGGRIAERLWLDYGIKSRCLVRNFSNAARLGRLPIQMIPGDLLHKSSIEEAVQGCDVIFHCAYGNTENPVINSQINEHGTKHLAEIALRNKIKRFLYLSSVAVYGPHPPENVTEETPIQLSDDEYGNSKIRAETICHDFLMQGLPIVILRPTVVFGPFSPIWTIGAIKRVLVGGWEIIKGVEGICNAVYVDDVVDSMLLSVKLDKAVGDTFIISGPNTVTWNEFFAAYMKVAGLPKPKIISGVRKTLKSYFSEVLRPCVMAARRIADSQIIDFYHSMQQNYPKLAGTFDTLIRGGIKKNEIEKFSLKTTYSISKAKRVLDYSPRTLQEGMRITADWLKHHGYI